jgi:hypothetical protein
MKRNLSKFWRLIAVDASDGGAYNLAEDYRYWFEICLYRGGVWSYCDEAVWNNR